MPLPREAVREPPPCQNELRRTPKPRLRLPPSPPDEAPLRWIYPRCPKNPPDVQRTDELGVAGKGKNQATSTLFLLGCLFRLGCIAVSPPREERIAPHPLAAKMRADRMWLGWGEKNSPSACFWRMMAAALSLSRAISEPVLPFPFFCNGERKKD